MDGIVMSEPTPEPTPTPAVVEPFNPGKAKGGGYNPDVTGGVSVPGRGTLNSQSSGGKGVWFLRPEPRTDIYVPGGTGPQQMAEYEAQAANQYYDPADLVGAYDSLDPSIQDLLTVVAKSQGGRSGSALFTRYVRESKRLSDSGIRRSPIDIAYNVAFNRGILKDDGTFTAPADGASVGGRGGRGGYSGPTASVTIAAESDVRATADAIAMEMIGRGINDEEYQRILKRTRSAEQTQPQVTTSGTGYSATQQGLTAEGRKDIVQNILAKKPEYEEFQKSTTLMDWFDRALSERPL
jgi:hypothetical protein